MKPMKKMGRPRTGPSSDEILAAIHNTGGTGTVGALSDQLQVAPNTVRARLAELTQEGSLTKIAQGLWQLPPSQLSLPDPSRRTLELLQATGLDAHLTGLAPLLPYTHQFVRQFPQLVYADPQAIDVVEDELAASGFIVARLGAGREAPVGDDLSNLVLLRKQSDPAQYGFRGHLATPEKAWVDLLRETHRGNLPMQFMEIGAILRNLFEGSINAKRLRNYARRMGYQAWIDRALGEAPASENERIEAVKAGFDS